MSWRRTPCRLPAEQDSEPLGWIRSRPAILRRPFCSDGTPLGRAFSVEQSREARQRAIKRSRPARTRWRDGQNGTGWRLRPYLRYTVPFSSRGKVGLTLSEEPFFDLNTTTFQSVQGLERLRSLVAITTPIGKHLSARS